MASTTYTSGVTLAAKSWRESVALRGGRGAWLFAFASAVMVPARPAHAQTPSSSGAPMLVGAISRADLEKEPFSEWFSRRYEGYAPALSVLGELRPRLADVSVEAYFGTWCGDSKRQVPGLLRILSDAGFDESRLSLYGLSDRLLEFKQAPGRPEAKRRVHRTPTFVVLRDGRELGRIVETPEATLEVDILNILKGNGPTPKYGAEARVHDVFVDSPAGGFEAALAAAATDIARRSEPNSLWHYAEHDLLKNNHPTEAKAVLDLYLKANPRSVRGHVLMAEALVALGRKREALESVERALAINPLDDQARRAAEKLRQP